MVLIFEGTSETCVIKNRCLNGNAGVNLKKCLKDYQFYLTFFEPISELSSNISTMIYDFRLSNPSPFLTGTFLHKKDEYFESMNS